MPPVKVSLNIKDQDDGEHLRLIVAAVIKPDETFEASLALYYLFFSVFYLLYYVCMYDARTHVPPLFPLLLSRPLQRLGRTVDPMWKR